LLQKVASSLGPRPPVWLAAFRAELREQQDESVSVQLQEQPASLRRMRPQARGPVLSEQFLEQMAPPPEAR